MLLRARIDYTCFYFKFHFGECVSFVVNLVLFFIMLFSSSFRFSSFSFAGDKKETILFVGFLFNVIWAAKELLEDPLSEARHKYTLEPSETAEKIIKKLSAKSGTVILRDDKKVGNTAVYYPNFDREQFTGRKILFQKNETITHYIQHNKTVLFKVLRCCKKMSLSNGKWFFNETKLCLSDDLPANSKAPVCCHRGSYYDSFLTNICSTQQLKSIDGEIVFDGGKLFPREKDVNGDSICLSPITSSKMNNHIGVSVLGITTDKYLILWCLTPRVQGYPGGNPLISTASGSCDWDDRKHGDSFLEVIEYAMKRELFEENDLRKVCRTPDEVGETRAIGYFRWVEKGGKPEFVGVSRLNCDYKAIRARLEVCDSSFYSPKRINSRDDLKKEISGLLNHPEMKLSLPLYMNLLFLLNYLDQIEATQDSFFCFLDE